MSFRRNPSRAGELRRDRRALQLSFVSKVACAGLITTLGTLCIGSGGFLIRQWRVERQELAESRILLAEVMATQASVALIFDDPESARESLSAGARVPDLRAAQLFDRQGRVFASQGPGPGVRPTGATIPTWTMANDALEIHVPVRVDNQQIGELVLVSGLEELRRSLTGYVIFSFLLFLALTSLSLTAAFWVAKRVVEPVRRLTAAMSEVRRSGEFERTVPVTSDDELGALTSEFNNLLSELKATVDDLVIARDEAQSADRLKTEFLANMSHEIRTPLNGVLGLAEVMAYDELSAPQRERLVIMQQSGRSLLALFNDLLDVAKIEGGRLELDSADFEMEPLARAACELFREQAEAKGLALRCAVGAEAEGLWRGDSFRVQQIIQNLLSNAVKFTAGGEVAVEVSADETRALVISVRDTGSGIDEEKLPLLFERFRQADNSTTRVFGGSGLGLSICRDLAALMGGDVQVRSRVGAGSTFRVRLPLTQVSQAQTPKARHAPELLATA